MYITCIALSSSSSSLIVSRSGGPELAPHELAGPGLAGHGKSRIPMPIPIPIPNTYYYTIPITILYYTILILILIPIAGHGQFIEVFKAWNLLQD